MGRDDAPGIVVLQEWWGVDYEVKNHAVKISELGSGFKALIPEYDVFSPYNDNDDDVDDTIRLLSSAAFY